MPKYVARLAQATDHPGVAVLRRVDTGDTLMQFPFSQAYELMGKRSEAFYVVSIRSGAYHLDNEIAKEDVDAVQTKLLGGKPVPRVEGAASPLEGS